MVAPSAGYRTLNLGYGSRHKPLEDLADDIHLALVEFASRVAPVHFVTHSMGGLLVRVYLARGRPPWLGRVVMLGPPNHGSAIADRLQNRRAFRAFFGPAGQRLTTRHGVSSPDRAGALDYPLGIIAGRRALNPLLSGLIFKEPNDGKVTVRSTMLPGMADHRVLDVAHPILTFDSRAVTQTIVFLRNGRFAGKTR